MVRQKHIQIVKAIGTGAAKSHFAWFFKSHRKTLDWKRFPEIVDNLTVIGLYFTTSVWNRFTKQDIKELEKHKRLSIHKAWLELRKQL